jgi:hypothetical protein
MKTQPGITFVPIRRQLTLLKRPTPAGGQHRLKKGQPLLGKGLAKQVDFSSYNLLTGGFHQ